MLAELHHLEERVSIYSHCSKSPKTCTFEVIKDDGKTMFHKWLYAS